jgi:hypothetical protein
MYKKHREKLLIVDMQTKKICKKSYAKNFWGLNVDRDFQKKCKTLFVTHMSTKN